MHGFFLDLIIQSKEVPAVKFGFGLEIHPLAKRRFLTAFSKTNGPTKIEELGLLLELHRKGSARSLRSFTVQRCQFCKINLPI